MYSVLEWTTEFVGVIHPDNYKLFFRDIHKDLRRHTHTYIHMYICITHSYMYMYHVSYTKYLGTERFAIVMVTNLSNLYINLIPEGKASSFFVKNLQVDCKYNG